MGNLYRMVWKGRDLMARAGGRKTEWSDDLREMCIRNWFAVV